MGWILNSEKQSGWGFSRKGMEIRRFKLFYYTWKWHCAFKYLTKHCNRKLRITCRYKYKHTYLIDLGPARYCQCRDIYGHWWHRERERVNTEQESRVGGADVRWGEWPDQSRHPGPGRVWAWSRNICTASDVTVLTAAKWGKVSVHLKLYRIGLSEISCLTQKV